MNLKGRICFITDGSDEEALLTILRSAIDWIQYREKNKTKREIFNQASRLRDVTREFDACFIVNDYVDIALAVDADGVHLGQDDLPIKEAKKIMGDRIIGVSTHNIREAMDAERQGADYIGFGSVFYTETKQDITVRGIAALREVVNSVKIPVIAIGGIKPNNAKQAFNAGCYGIAVSSGLLKGDIEENAKNFLSIVREVRL